MKATVLLITYNHAPFIRQAIDSVLEQETDFNFEFLISDDCSSDGTREILLEYAGLYPDRIRLRLNPVNMNSNADFEDALNATRGEYVALLEGDDYWTCPTKLQRQVEYLDAHPKCSICFHNMQVLQDGVLTELYNLPTQTGVSRLEDLLKGNFIATGSVILRHEHIPKFPSWYNTVFCGDWGLMVLIALRGQICYINESMGVYRVHSGGMWTSLSHHNQVLHKIRFYATIRQCLSFRQRIIARRQESRFWFQLAIMRSKMGQHQLALECLRKTLHDLPCTMKLLLYLANPGLFESMRRTWRRLRLRPL